jgi:hypothetical protein
MSQSRANEQYKKTQQEKTFGVANTQGGDSTVAGRAVYRREYQRDYGTGLDQSLDGAEFGSEF